MLYVNNMIEINLLPEELKTKTKNKKTTSSAGPFIFETKYIFYIVPLVFGILICTHIYLGLVYFVKSGQLRQLSSKWQGLEPQRKELEVFNSEYAVISENAKAIQQLSQSRINWAQKLNLLSLGLPSGVWYTEISVTANDFLLQGSVVALQKEELTLINKLIFNLKNDPAFFKDFNNLELNSVQKRNIGGYDIADFVLQGALKSK